MSQRPTVLMFADPLGPGAPTATGQDELRELFRNALPAHGGQAREAEASGFLAEFGSPADAVRCAVELQAALRGREPGLRIGIHLADTLTVPVVARIEKMARSGGICLSRPLVELAGADLPFRTKKIDSDLYRVLLPWEGTRAYPRLSPGSLALSGLFAGGLAILAFMAPTTWNGASRGADATDRSPASSTGRFIRQSEPAPQRVDLSTGWEYAPESNNRSPEGLPSPPSRWLPFDPAHPSLDSGRLTGRYWLRKTFGVSTLLRSPALVLGSISDSNRVFLNGRFIGGSDRPGDVAYYVFDPALLNLSGPNTLLVVASARSTLAPGLSLAPGTGAFLGTFEDVREAVSEGQLRDQVLRTVLLSLSFALFAAFLGVALVRRENRHFVYCSLFLLLGTIGLVSADRWISGVLAYPFEWFLRSIALALQPLVLCSAYLRVRGRRSLETLNNGATLGAATGIAAMLLIPDWAPSRYVSAYDAVIVAALGVTLAWMGTAAFWRVREIFGAPEHRRPRPLELGGRALAALCFLVLAGSYRPLSPTHFPSVLTIAAGLGTVALPFLLAAFALASALVENAGRARAAGRERSRDQLVLGLIQLINGSGNPGSADVTRTVGAVQERVARFLRSRRSTLYVLEQKNGGRPVLNATFVYGDERAHERVRREVSPEDGPLGYVCAHRSPLLIQDIRKDLRFSAGDVSGYRTGSCMIFPLVAMDQLVGALTFADKEGDLPFTHEDFAMALEVAKDLSLLLDNRRLQERLSAGT